MRGSVRRTNAIPAMMTERVHSKPWPTRDQISTARLEFSRGLLPNAAAMDRIGVNSRGLNVDPQSYSQVPSKNSVAPDGADSVSMHRVSHSCKGRR